MPAEAALAYAVSPRLELYANWGRGFHSNDVRGAVIATPVPVLVRGTGKELGGRAQVGRLSLTATYWWLDVDSELPSHARYDNGNYIPNAFENAGQVGASLILPRVEASVRLRHLGPYPLIEDNSQRDGGSTVVNLRSAFKPGPVPGSVELFAELLNVFDSRDKDIAYYYESYIPAFEAAPVEGRLSRVVEPRTLRVGAKIRI